MSELAKYSFLPWVRQGIASEISEVDNLGAAPPADPRARASILINAKVQGVPVGGSNYEHAQTVGKSIQIVGPGEVIGLNKRSIVKVEPLNGITNFEPHYLPYIEFYEEDLPWRYSPARADGGKLRPWLWLLVLEVNEFERIVVPNSPNPAITHGEQEIAFPPDGTQTWAWAHVHVNKFLLNDENGDDEDRGNRSADALFNLIQSNPNAASARLLCPRRLKANTAYHAFLIPAFEQGRLAGLGAKNERIIQSDVQLHSWAEHQADEFAGKWPYFHEWYFRTGNAEDFEFLVRQIDPVVLDASTGIGKRPMDMQDRSFGDRLFYSGGNRTLQLEGAIQTTDVFREDFENYVDETETDLKNEKRRYVQELKDILNLNVDLKEPTSAGTNPLLEFTFFAEDDQIDDPIVLPPMYGVWHSGEDPQKINFNDDRPEADTPTEPTDGQREYWFHQLNLDPRNRVAAAFGTKNIQKHQESLMDRAWEQVGDILRANDELKAGTFSLEISNNLYQNYFENLPPVDFINCTALLHAKASLSQLGGTVRNFIADSQVPTTIMQGGFTKFTRPNNPLIRRAGANLQTGVVNEVMTNHSDILSSPANIQQGGLVYNSNDFNDIINQIDGGVVGGGVVFSPPNFNDRPGGWIDSGVLGDILNRLGIGGGIIGTATSAVVAADSEDENEFLATIPGIQDWLNDDSNWREAPQVTEVDLEDDGEGSILTTLSTRLSPSKTVSQKVWKTVKIGRRFIPETNILFATSPMAMAFASQNPDELFQVMAYPKFQEPTYIELRDESEELLLPGMDKIPNESFSLLKTNQAFIEAFMVGLNHEMARELLWREYPTDLRGTYFCKFWEDADNVIEANRTNDIKEIHLWNQDVPAGSEYRSLGENHPLGEDQGNRLIFVVRGELLKKFPNTVIYLQKAKWVRNAADNKIHGRTINEDTPLYQFPAFQAKAEPDITFLGFNHVSPIEANGVDLDIVEDEDFDVNNEPEAFNSGWFVVVKERPGETAFGADLPIPDEDTGGGGGEFTEWEDLSWDKIDISDNGFIDLNTAFSDSTKPIDTRENTAEFGWAKNAAHMANILLQVPFMVAIHASDMLPDDPNC